MLPNIKPVILKIPHISGLLSLSMSGVYSCTDKIRMRFRILGFRIHQFPGIVNNGKIAFTSDQDIKEPLPSTSAKVRGATKLLSENANRCAHKENHL